MASERDLDQLCQVLVACVPGCGAVTAVTPVIAGHSNETYVLEGIDAILRLPPASEPLMPSHGIVTQALIYRALSENPKAPRAPRILHLSETNDLLGAPFFIMEKVPGRAVPDYSIPAWFTDAPAEKREQVSRQWARAIGSIAALEPLAVLGRSVSPKQEAIKWRTMAAGANSSELVAMFDRLLARPAPISGPSAPVQGDPKIANLMWQDFELSAVLDWELAYNGEPLSDLGYMLYFFRNEAYSGEPLPALSGMIDRAEVVKEWEAASGRSAEGWEWFEAAGIAKMTAIIAHGYNLATAGHSFDPRWLRWKTRLDANVELLGILLR